MWFFILGDDGFDWCPGGGWVVGVDFARPFGTVRVFDEFSVSVDLARFNVLPGMGMGFGGHGFGLRDGCCWMKGRSRIVLVRSRLEFEASNGGRVSPH